MKVAKQVRHLQWIGKRKITINYPKIIMKIFQAFKCTIHQFINRNLKRGFTRVAYGQLPVRSLERRLCTGRLGKGEYLWVDALTKPRVESRPLLWNPQLTHRSIFSSSFFSNPDSYVSRDVSLTVSAVLTDGQCLVSKSRESNSDSGNGATHLWTRIQLTIIGL